MALLYTDLLRGHVFHPNFQNSIMAGLLIGKVPRRNKWLKSFFCSTPSKSRNIDRPRVVLIFLKFSNHYMNHCSKKISSRFFQLPLTQPTLFDEYT